jgi:hypothetical protein
MNDAGAAVYQWYMHLQPLVSVEVLLLAVNLLLAVVLVALAAALDPDRERIAVCDYLDNQRVTIVVARPRDSQAKRWYFGFHGWISDHPDHFETIHKDSEYILVRTLNRPRPNLTP